MSKVTKFNYYRYRLLSNITFGNLRKKYEAKRKSYKKQLILGYDTVFVPRGQHMQDAFAYLYFDGKKNGFFVDLGANDGIGHSNTYSLEALGWSGICIEARPDFFVRLEKNRSCYKHNVALSNIDGVAPYIVSYTEEFQGWSGLTSTMDERRIARIEDYGNTEMITVPTMTFSKLMENYPEVTHIDFFSLDVEGHEMNVLEGIDFNKFSFGLMTIEKGQDSEKLKEFLDSKGYRAFLEIEADILFIPKECER